MNAGVSTALDGTISVVGLFFAQGSPLSNILNHVPFINATAGVHDFIFNAKWLPFDAWTNPLMMSPAALFAIPAALGNNNINWITAMKWSGGQP